VWPWARETPEILGIPFNISATVKASDFKFGTQLKFAKAHHKITPRRKAGWPWARGAPQNFGFYNIFATAGASDVISGLGLGLGKLPKIFWFRFNIYTTAEAMDLKFDTQLWFAKAHHKTTPREKVGVTFS